MLRFLRKNEKAAKWTLVVGMVLLLVSWLVADGSTQLFRFMALAGTRWATVDGSKVTLGDLESVQQEMRVVNALGDPTFKALKADEDPTVWFLLTREAEQAGLVGGTTEGARMLAAIAEQQKVSEGQVLGALAGASGLSGQGVLDTLAKVAGVRRLVQSTVAAPASSDIRLKQRAAELLIGLTGMVVVLDGRSEAAGAIPAPAETRLEEQFVLHRDTAAPAAARATAPGLGAPAAGYGYRLPDRVRVEWLEVPATSIRSAVEASAALTSLELRKYWLEHPEEFAQSALAAEGGGFEAVREQVRTRVLDSMVAERRAEIAKYATDRLQLALRGLPQQGGLYTLPQDWASRQVSLAELASEVSARFALAQPTVGGVQDRWITPGEIAALPGVGGATTDKFGKTPVPAAQLAAATHELGAASAIPVQVGVATPPLTTPDGNLYFFRVTAAEANRSPKDLNEVRAEVTADVTAIDRFAALVEAESRMRTIAAEQGIDALAAAYGATAVPVKDLREADPQFLVYGYSIPSSIPGLGSDAEALGGLVRAAMKLPAGAAIDTLPAADRVLVVEVPDRLAVVVMRLDALAPMTVEQYATLAPSGALRRTVDSDADRNADPRTMYSHEALAERHRFELARDDADANDAAAPAPSN